MKRFFPGAVLGVFVVIALALPGQAEQKYTNEDLGKFRLEGAYTNADLRGLEPLAVQAEPLSTLPQIDLLTPMLREESIRRAEYDALRWERARLQAQLEYQWERIDASYGPRGGRVPNARNLRARNRGVAYLAGQYSDARPRLEYLERRIADLDWQLANF